MGGRLPLSGDDEVIPATLSEQKHQLHIPTSEAGERTIGARKSMARPRCEEDSFSGKSQVAQGQARSRNAAAEAR